MSQLEEVRAGLKQIDGLLDVIEHPAFRRYALVAWWPDNEPKRELVRNGEMDPNRAYDILGWFTTDPWDAGTEPLDVALDARVMDIIGKSDNTKSEWRDRFKQATERSIETRRKLREGILDRAESIAKDLYYISGHREAVSMERIMKEITEEARDE